MKSLDESGNVQKAYGALWRKVTEEEKKEFSEWDAKEKEDFVRKVVTRVSAKTIDASAGSTSSSRKRSPPDDDADLDERATKRTRR